MLKHIFLLRIVLESLDKLRGNSLISNNLKRTCSARSTRTRRTDNFKLPLNFILTFAFILLKFLCSANVTPFTALLQTS
jgi:hypothetical protein